MTAFVGRDLELAKLKELARPNAPSIEDGKNFWKINGRGDRIRTCDIYVPNVALYQSELHPGENSRESAAR
jgi:hypothetical protein